MLGWLDVFCSISNKWHRWYNLQSRKPWTDTEPHQPHQREGLSTKEKMNVSIQQLFGPTGRFRSQKQEDAIIAVVEGVSPIHIILPTGAGKSLAFMVHVLFQEAGTTVVITPLAALAENMLDRYKDAGIDCILHGRVLSCMAKIIIIVTKSATSASFHQMILDIHLKGRLDRIVFDEVHKLITDVNFRPKLENLQKLSLSVQYISLTATFPHP